MSLVHLIEHSDYISCSFHWFIVWQYTDMSWFVCTLYHGWILGGFQFGAFKNRAIVHILASTHSFPLEKDCWAKQQMCSALMETVKFSKRWKFTFPFAEPHSSSRSLPVAPVSESDSCRVWSHAIEHVAAFRCDFNLYFHHSFMRSDGGWIFWEKVLRSPNLAWNLWFFCLQFSSAEMMFMHYHVWFNSLSLSLCACGVLRDNGLVPCKYLSLVLV